MDKLKPNRKPASSPKSLDRIAMIISENWAETWKIVRQRSQTNKAIDRQNLRKSWKKCIESH